MPAAGPVPFDQVAGDYDERRGGVGRGQALADGLIGYLAPAASPRDQPLAVEIGVGTAVVAAALAERGWSVVGVDISAGMLNVARCRLPAGLIQADVRQLPIRTGSADAVYGVWVLHVSGSPKQVVKEAARVLRAGGRFVYVPSRPERPTNDVDDLLADLGTVLRGGRPRVDAVDAVRGMAIAAGLVEIEHDGVSVGSNLLSPAVAQQQLMDRVWSPLWTLTEDQWHRHVGPVIGALAALPDQERPRTGRDRYDALVFAKKITG